MAEPESQSKGVHRFLVTAEDGARFDMWHATGAYANWIDGRENERRGEAYETWLVTVFGEHEEHFLTAARATGVTVEEIEGGGDTERYELRVGEPGTGWAEAADADA